ncbi:CPBP family intramembrane glutamic endopeptidase [Nonomuraea longicatena]|uniref:CAAX prenyl protease 2/Lysostaphin resistance protein A-like domain-containing protein n=1 Tax=Nonomuraea longicatena TaxID=83682 RepID=A0ABN1NWT0_9ACTN
MIDGPVGRAPAAHALALPASAALFAVAYLSPIGAPRSDLADTSDTLTQITVLVAGFAVNALLEEVFYRRWLQTRLETVLGRWPAVLLASLLSGVWHVGIMGGPLPESLAMSLVHQGAIGVLLGYLWSRYRLMWPILTAHGALNAAPIVLGTM